MKRWISLLLALCLLCPLGLPADAAAPRSWAAIARIEQQAEAGEAPQGVQARSRAYGLAADQMIRAVQAAPDYLPGSLERHGDFFFWRTADGRANGYSPALRARIREAEAAQAVSAPPAPTGGEEALTPDSRDVGVFIPYSGSYYFYPEQCVSEGTALARSTGGALHVYTAENTNVDTLAEAISLCGILLINSHGLTDYELGTDHSSRANSSYVCLPTDAGFTATDQLPVAGKYGTYYHAFYSGPSSDFDEEYYCVDGTCISNHMKAEAPGSMVWLGLCLGMVTEGLFAPLRARGVEALIGFSEAVTTNADHAYRRVLCEGLLQDLPLGEAAARMKAEVGCPDPYQTAHDPAYPIAVSSQDPYPGRDHLTEGQEVQSTWKLYPPYPIEVRIEPEGSADAVLTRTTLAVTPRRGFVFSHWAVTEGEAQGTRTGDVLDLAPAGPCTVTLHMEARTPAAVRFVPGPGQTAPEIQAYLGDTVTLPAPEGTLTAEDFLYHFLGWTTEALAEDSPQAPALRAAGSALSLTQEETTFYGVYGYYAPEDGTSRGAFRLVTQAPTDWTGDYVLTYQSTRALRASERCTGQSIISAGAAPRLADLGCFVDGEWLNEVPEELVYTFSPDDAGAGTLKMKTSENYLLYPTSGLLSTGTDPTAAAAQWRMTWSDDAVVITNARYPSRILQFSPTSSGFCTLTTLRKPMTLYARVPGAHLYTTQPGAASAACPGRIFADLPPEGHWAHAPIDWAVSQGVTLGTGANAFSPNAPCTRAQIVTFLWRSAGCPAPESACPFSDVPAGAYYAEAVAWAAEAGVTLGTGGGTFRPRDPCTRAQAVAFLWRFVGSPSTQDGDCPFRDLDGAEPCRSAVCWAAETGITTGTGPGTFSPRSHCTRAQIVAFLYRLLG